MDRLALLAMLTAAACFLGVAVGLQQFGALLGRICVGLILGGPARRHGRRP